MQRAQVVLTKEVLHVSSPQGISSIVALPYRSTPSFSTSLRIAKWQARDPIGEDGGINLYGYVGNDPVNLVDPLGLWQFTFSAGAGIGMTTTFGYNSGQANFGSYVGYGAGMSFRFQPEDSHCRHEDGAFPETRLSASLPVWETISIPISQSYNNYDGSKVNIGFRSGVGRFGAGFSNLGSKSGSGYISVGGGVFGGAGVHSYF